MSLINIKQIRNLPQADTGALIVFNGTTNVWTNQDTGAILVPAGTSAQRPVSATNGYIRYNDSSSIFEFYENGIWRTFSTFQVDVSSAGGGQSLLVSVSGDEITLRSIEGEGIVDVRTSGGVIIVSAADRTPTFTVTNVGTGVDLALGVSANRDFRFRTILGGGIVEVTTVGDDIVISAAAFVQEDVTVSSKGAGSQVIQTISGGTEIIQRTIIGGGAIEVTQQTDTITISAAAFVQEDITVSSKGTGNAVIETIDNGTEIIQRTIVGAGIVNVATVGGEIIVSAADQTPTFTQTNLGGGAEVALSVSANRDFRFRTITGTGNIEVTTSGNTINISAAEFMQAPITVSALGGGASPVIDVSGGAEIRFRTFTAGGIVEVIQSGNTVNISAAQFVQAPVTTSAKGGGESPVIAVSGGTEIIFKTFTGSGNIDVTTSGDTIKISASQFVQAPITLSSFGGGEEITIAVSGGTELQFRSITGGGIVEATTSGNTIKLSAAQFVQSPITVSALGGGATAIASVSGGTEIRQREIVGGGIVEVTETSTTITLSAAQFVQAPITASAAGTGTSIIVGTSGQEITLRSVLGGGIIDISTAGGDIVISAAAFVQEDITASAKGGGAEVIQTISGGTEIIQRTIIGGGTIEVTQQTDTITLSAAQFVQAPVTTSAKGGGESPVIEVSSGTEIIFKSFTGSGIIDVTTSGDTIKISAADRTPTFTVTNLGIGDGIAVDVSANRDFRFKSIVGLGIIEISAGANEIVISARNFPVTVSSLGTGVAVIANVSGSTEINQRTLVGAGNVQLSAGATEITISGGGLSTAISTSGTSLIFDTAGGILQLRGLTGQGIVDVRTTTSAIVVSAARAVITTSALGGGADIVSTVSAGGGNEIEIIFKTIVGAGSVQVSAGLTEITISAPSVDVAVIQISGGDNILSEPLIATTATARSSKILSTETSNLLFTRTGNIGADVFIAPGANTNTDTRIIMPYDGTVIRATGHCVNVANNDKYVSVYVNDTEYTQILMFTGADQSSPINTGVNIDFIAGDGIRLRTRQIAGGNIQHVTITVWVKWREV